MNWLPEGWEPIAVKAITAIAVIVVAIVIWRIIQRPFRRLENATSNSKVGLTIFKNILRVILWVWAGCVIADVCFGVDIAGVFGALGIVGIAVSLGAQQTIANVIGGIIISLSGMVGIGDWVTIQGHREARLIDTNWRQTTLEDENGVKYAVPNSVMVSTVVEIGRPFFPIIIPFSLKPSTPDVDELLRECEQTLLDAQVQSGTDYEKMSPKANVMGASLGAIQAEVKIFANREFDTRSVERAVLPALVNLLQEKDALAEIAVQPAE